MKLRIIHIALVLFCTILFSCIKNCVDHSSKFRLRFEIVATKSGTISIEYLSREQNSEEKITANIQGSEDSQFVEFCLSEEPKSFNMYISKALANIDFTIFNILLENKDNQMFIKREMINLY